MPQSPYQVQVIWTTCAFFSQRWETCHEWMSSSYIDMPSNHHIRFILHKPFDGGRDDRAGEIQLHFCKHHLPLFICYVGRVLGDEQAWSERGSAGCIVKQSKPIKKLSKPMLYPDCDPLLALGPLPFPPQVPIDESPHSIPRRASTCTYALIAIRGPISQGPRTLSSMPVIHHACSRQASQVNRPSFLPHTLASRSSTYLSSMTCPQRRPPPPASKSTQVQHRDLCTLAEAETLRSVSNVRTQVCARWVRPRRLLRVRWRGGVEARPSDWNCVSVRWSESLFSVGMQHAG